MTFKTKFPKDEFLKYLSSVEPKSTKEIADLTGCTSNTAKTALFQLEGEGKVIKWLVSGKYYIWMTVEKISDERIIKIQNELGAIEEEYRKKTDEGTISEDEKNYLMGIIHAEQIIERVCSESEKMSMSLDETGLDILKTESKR